MNVTSVMLFFVSACRAERQQALGKQDIGDAEVHNTFTKLGAFPRGWYFSLLCRRHRLYDLQANNLEFYRDRSKTEKAAVKATYLPNGASYFVADLAAFPV